MPSLESSSQTVQNSAPRLAMPPWNFISLFLNPRLHTLPRFLMQNKNNKKIHRVIQLFSRTSSRFVITKHKKQTHNLVTTLEDSRHYCSCRTLYPPPDDWHRNSFYFYYFCVSPSSSVTIPVMFFFPSPSVRSPETDAFSTLIEWIIQHI